MKKRILPYREFARAPLLFIIPILMMMQCISTDVYIPSLPAIATYFDTNTLSVQLTLSVFVVGFGTAQLAMGPLSDRFGRRPMLLIGLSLYCIASIICLFSPSIWILIGARFIQAIGCSSAFIIARVVIRDAYRPEHGMLVMARSSTWLSLGPLLATTVGGWLQVLFGWQGAFGLHTLVSFCLIILVWRTLPETNQHKNPMATQLSSILETYRIVLGSKTFWANAIIGAFSYASIFAFISGASMVFIRILHMPVTCFGYIFSLGTLGYLVGTLLCRRMLPKLGQTLTMQISTTFTLISGLIFISFTMAGILHWTIVLFALFTTMFVHGINSPITQAGAITPFPGHAGVAAGLSGAIFMIAAFTISSIIGITYNGTLYPLACIVFVNGLLPFICVRLFRNVINPGKKQRNTP